jgi:hypothetical protein
VLGVGEMARHKAPVRAAARQGAARGVSHRRRRLLRGRPRGRHRGRQVGELLEVLLAERLDLPRPAIGQAQAHDGEVFGVLAARDQPGLLGAIDKPHRAVVAQHEVAGHVADGRPAWVVVAAYREQQLVLGGGQAGGLGVLLAPAQEAAQAGAQLQQAPVVLVGGRRCAHALQHLFR